MVATFKSIFLTTLRDPRQGTRDVIGLNLPVQGLWIVLLLVAVVLALFASGSIQMAYLATEQLSQSPQVILDDQTGAAAQNEELPDWLVPPLFADAPILMAIMNWFQAAVTVYVLHWISRMVGGQGELNDMLAAVIWVQVVTLLMGFVLLLVAIVIPPVGALGLLLLFFWGIWAFVGGVDAASGFGSLFKAFGVCVAALLALSFISTTVISILGVMGIGGLPNV
ncbi:MAG: Yip1 family protein [Pseudomonadota bacterium]